MVQGQSLTIALFVMDQVKRLYDTFNEPFRRVTKKHRVTDSPACPSNEQGNPSVIDPVPVPKSKLFSESTLSLRDALNAARSVPGHQSTATVELSQNDNEADMICTQLPISKRVDVDSDQGEVPEAEGHDEDVPVSLA